MYYSFGLPSFVLVKVMEPAFFARQNTKTPMIIAICCLVTNIIFNYVFMLFDYGFVGIILSSIASTYLNLSLLIYNLLRKKYFHFEKFFIKKLIKIVIPSLLMGISLYFLKLYFTNNNDFNKILELIIMISLGILIYFFTAYLSGSLKIMIDAIKIKRQKNDAINL
jgi:putative peptidoglycan lipid II flippase